MTRGWPCRPLGLQILLLPCLLIMSSCAAPSQSPTAEFAPAWQRCESPVDALLLAGRFVDDRRGFAVGGTTERGPSIVLRTEDCGAHWHQVDVESHGRLYDIDFPTLQRGYAAGYGVLLRSVDAGATWQQLPMPADRWLAAVAFTSSDVGFVAGGHGSAPVLWQTTDGGETWRDIADRLPAEGIDALRDVVFTDDLHGYVLGDGGYLCETHDGGEQWARIATGTSAWLRSLHIRAGRMWIASSPGLYMRQSGTSEFADVPSVGRRKLSDVRFVDDQRGWCTDFAGVVLQTTDGGGRWSPSLTLKGTPTDLVRCGDEWLVVLSDAGIWRLPIRPADRHTFSRDSSPKIARPASS